MEDIVVESVEAVDAAVDVVDCTVDFAVWIVEYGVGIVEVTLIVVEVLDVDVSSTTKKYHETFSSSLFAKYHISVWQINKEFPNYS